MEYSGSDVDLLSNSSNSSSSGAEADSWFQIFWYFVLFVAVIYLCKQGDLENGHCCAPTTVVDVDTMCHLCQHGMPWALGRFRRVMAGNNCVEKPLRGKRRNTPRGDVTGHQRAGARYT